MLAVPRGTFVMSALSIVRLTSPVRPCFRALRPAFLSRHPYKSGFERRLVPKFTVEPTEVMRKYRVIAVVGASKNPEKDANTVPAYLQDHGYTIIPVNPTTNEVNGLKAYPSLADIPDELARTVEVVDVFRPSEELPEVARKVAEMRKKTGRPFVFWAQLHLENEDAKRILGEAEVDYVMDRCMRIEHAEMRTSR